MDEAIHERMHGRAFFRPCGSRIVIIRLTPALKRGSIIATLAISPASHDAPNGAYWIRIATRNYKYAALTALARFDTRVFFPFAAGIRASPGSEKQNGRAQ